MEHDKSDRNILELPGILHTMSTELKAGLPFAHPDEHVGESKHRSVYGYNTPHVVIKVDETNPFHDFGSLSEALGDIKEHQKEREIILKASKKWGISDDQIPSSGFVVHSSEKGNITYTEVQTWYKGGKTLYKSKSRITALPDRSLRELKSLFDLNIAIWKEQGRSIDLVGSSGIEFSTPAKLVRRLLPLFFSENIIIDDTNEVKMIDHGLHKLNIRNSALRVKFEVIGSYISSKILDTILFVRRLHSLFQNRQIEYLEDLSLK